ncbi:hypothetical protein [Thaumasiovibrio subtropicus]|uniref:hypothetical protein n=1 Tax=Thaumasiovibrio subtropicus TaxID=1891207 RepID=UPI000B359E76|nr:hypothetical protein [Thaumasiovibrio subtropicus]
MKYLSIASFIALFIGAGVSADEKHHEDPTRIVTKVGVGYSDVASISGSLGLDDARMVSARVNEEGEWRIGGSWLFDVGILNFNFSRTDYDNEGYKNNYSVGTFVPLSYFDIAPAGWNLFPMAGYGYNQGEVAMLDLDSPNEYTMVRSKFHSGYVGMFGLRPLGSSNWTVLAFAGGALGSEKYRSYWGGAGVSYKLNEQASFNMYAVSSEDDFGSNRKVGGSFSYRF